MPGGLGPRFALEAGFLIVLAAVATYARLDTIEIVLVMAGGWLLASIFEVLAARRERLYPEPTWERPVEKDEAPAAKEPEDVEPEPAPQPAPSPQPAPAPVAEEAPAPAVPQSPPPPRQVDEEATGEIEPPKRRRWLRRRGPAPAVAPEPEPAARPSARHVRLIRGTAPANEGGEDSKDAEAGP